MELPKEIQNKINLITDYLQRMGCSKILLFGSIAEGNYYSNSDIDIAVSGIKPKDFFRAMFDLPLMVKQNVDLVDYNDLFEGFKKLIEEDGIVLYEK